MTREDIEQVAEEYADRISHYKTTDLISYVNGFVAGANWRINSVWHEASEKPHDLRMLVAIGKDSFPFVCGPNNLYWSKTVEVIEIVRWAYIEDLLPIKD